MAGEQSKGGFGQGELAAFRAGQEEMENLAREYSQARLDLWAEELNSLEENWEAFSRQWQDDLEQMSGWAEEKFGEIAAQGEVASSSLAQNWQSALGEISGTLEDWGEQFLATLAKASSSWLSSLGDTGGASESALSWLGSALGVAGWFHQGGIVEAHQGMLLSAGGGLMSDERLVLAQTGEGILPRESVARLGEENFEALRTGRFAVSPGSSSPRFDITIQVQSLDAAGVAGLDWDRLVQRHLLPALQKEAGRRW